MCQIHQIVHFTYMQTVHQLYLNNTRKCINIIAFYSPMKEKLTIWYFHSGKEGKLSVGRRTVQIPIIWISEHIQENQHRLCWCSALTPSSLPLQVLAQLPAASTCICLMDFSV